MKFAKMILMIAFCAYAPSVWAQTANVDALIVKSGLQRQVEQIPEVIKASFEQRFQQDPSMSAKDRYNLRTAAEGSFEPVGMLRIVREGVAAGLTEAEIGDVLKWLDSPLGTKITQLEEQSSSGEAYKKMMDFAQNMGQPDPNRLSLIERMDKAAQLTECSVRMKMDVSMAMVEAVAKSCSEECENFSQEAVAREMGRVRPQMQESSHQEMIINSLFTYQTLSDSELEEYIKFYATPAGQKYMKVVSESLSQAVKNSSTKMGEMLGAALKEKKAMSRQ